MWDELGISAGTAIIVLIALYFIIKWAVRNGVKEACRELIKGDHFMEGNCFMKENPSVEEN